jgi:hypothetical protein
MPVSSVGVPQMPLTSLRKKEFVSLSLPTNMQLLAELQLTDVNEVNKEF